MDFVGIIESLRFNAPYQISKGKKAGRWMAKARIPAEH